jgi:hypothetical protein
MPRTDRVFNRQARKVLRRKIGLAETVFGACFIVVLALSTFWVLAQKDNFDPADRDISYETLQVDSTGEVLYETPLKLWVEPGRPGAAAAPALDTGIFPAAIVGEGWGLDGRVESFDPSNVYEKINGAAEQYLAFGFRSLHWATLTDGTRSIAIELYDQGSFANVLGIFAAQGGSQREVQTEGDMFYYRTSVGAIGGYGPYYFKIAGDDASEAVLAAAARILATMDDLPAQESSAPLAYHVMTRRLGLSLGDVAYERENVFQYDSLSDFWFGKVPKEADARYFMHAEADAAAAAQVYERFLQEQARDHKVLDQSDDRVLMQHGFLKTIFALQREGAILMGVDGAATRESAAGSLERLREAVRRERQASPEA